MIRGWCPSLHEPMATGDGLLVRVKPPLGHVSAADARALALAAVAYGNGAIELTGRGTLQFRGLTAESAVRFAAVAVELGLAVADPAAERRRSVLVSPMAGLDPAVAADTIDLARALEAALLRDDALAALPAKFGFAVDGDRTLPLGAGADINLIVGDEGWLVVPAGAARGVVVDRADAVPAVLRMAHAFLALAGDARRMRGVSERVLALSQTRPLPSSIAGSSPAMTGRGIGPLYSGAFGVGVPFGSFDAATLAGLGDIRLTPWRVIVVTGSVDAARFAAMGLITSPDDPRLLVSACPGEPGCASASVRTRDIAATLRPTGTVHVSGCSKGCAHPGPAGLTFVGREGRFDLVRNGRAGDLPVRWGIDADAVGLTQ